MPYSGGGGNPTINTAQTPDGYYLSTDPLNNAIIIGEAADAGFDFAHAQATDPTLFIHSHNQNTTQWVSLYHNATIGVLETASAAGLVFRANSVNLVNVVQSDSTVRVASGANLGFSSNANAAAATNDAFFTREGAATIQMGSDVNGAAVAQTLKAHDGITGTDIAGADLTIAGGRGTGAGAGGDIRLKTSPVLGTGTTAQVLNDRDVVVAKSKTLSDAVATAFVTIAVPAAGMCGGFIEYAIMASNGTDHQCRAGVLPFAIVNKADTETTTLATVGAATEVVAVSVGTLTNTFTATAGTNSVTINANADTSLATTSPTINYKVHINGSVSGITVTAA